MIEFFLKYELLIVPFFTWFGIQLFKFFYDKVETKKMNFKRLMGNGGMPSAHSGTVMALTTLIGKRYGISDPLFATAAIFSIIVMSDAAGVRQVVGKQSKVLNDILKDKQMTGYEKLQEMTGHTPFQVFVGGLIGFIVGLIF